MWSSCFIQQQWVINIVGGLNVVSIFVVIEIARGFYITIKMASVIESRNARE